jgi:hypothetical protein
MGNEPARADGQQAANPSQNGLVQQSMRFKVCSGIRFTTAVLILATTCFAQEGFTVRSNGKQEWPAAEAQKIYHSACIIVQQEFGAHRIVRPQFTLVLGAEKNEINVDQREVRLTKWDRYLFAQGAIRFAFEDLMPPEQRTTMVKRAVTWADSTIEIKRVAK